MGPDQARSRFTEKKNKNKTTLWVIFNWNHFEMRILNLRINFYILRTFCSHLGSFCVVFLLRNPIKNGCFGLINPIICSYLVFHSRVRTEFVIVLKWNHFEN